MKIERQENIHQFAMDEETGKIVDIQSIDSTKAQSMRFICPKCQKNMYPTFGKKMIHHFRHNGEKCKYDDYLHKTAEMVFLEEYSRCLENNLPFYVTLQIPHRCDKKCSLYNKRAHCKNFYHDCTINLTETYKEIFSETNLETDEGTRRPDILLRSADGRELWIEIHVTNPTKKSGETQIIEIDIRSHANIEEFRSHKLSQPDSKGRIRIYGYWDLYSKDCPSPVFSRTYNPISYNPISKDIRIKTSPIRLPTIKRKPNASSEDLPFDPSEVEWVDLGLPSGTLWSKEVVGRCTYSYARQCFRGYLPSEEQILELRVYCKNKYYDQITHEEVLVGPNGNELRIKLIKSQEFFWSDGRSYDESGQKNCFGVISGNSLYPVDCDSFEKHGVILSLVK